MSRTGLRAARVAAWCAAGLFAACGGGGAGGGGAATAPTTGQLEVRMHDRPSEGVEHVYVTIERVEVLREVDGADVKSTLSSQPGQYDLLELQHGVEAVLGQGQFEPGLYHWIRLVVARDSKRDMARKPADTLKNYVVASGVPHPLVVPSGENTGIKLGHNFTIEAGQTTVLTLDFDVRQSVQRCGRNHVYRLKPRIRVVPTTPGGSDDGIVGSVTTTDGTGLPSGTVVSAQQAGVEVASATVDGTGGYHVAGLADGTYDLVAIAPGYAYGKELGVVVSGGAAAGNHDFALAPTGTGAVYGVVTPAGENLTVRLYTDGLLVATVGGDPSTGEYVFDAVPPGDYTVVATDGVSSASGTVTAVAASAVPLDLSL